ncbi:MAG: crossover junction endodeoxyribonuclease RuvC [Candidatus Yonathbacteria bacterium RIFOXYC1_FULL_52_10]|uniref:Crossover junction endodeoxyribonuclease RuvC n=1 Tax=Candidatus Yonathbacteria bacterium RIFOXYD1_FULL_52_36 TaxID=1802730 RepID=A0A1G2SLZ0_9BACT|nr:MAG: crossover junction endodeoxyribonuclease RuvC [Candidatus Yonathbacteria bacterium RIFOXYC1_FULL_52_10]OHA85964.1 MAG: crossover junction endodeoxyribonuclease RuvC [Candidatus Yonathbacteria bacterium RIFOXYD1_FULL_52_36]
MRILAIDPGFERMGVAIVSREQGREELVYSACVQTSAKLPFPERLKLLGDAIDELVLNHHPEAVALETLFFGKNEKTASKVAEVRGMLLYKATVLGLPVHEYTPMQVKVAVAGYGKADKVQVATMVRSILKTSLENKLDDEMDAIAIGLTHFAHAGLVGRVSHH